MRTISNSEFAAHAEMYLDTALSPDEDLRRALPADEFRQRLAVVLDRVDKKYAAK